VKSIADFVAGKIRRAEVGGDVAFHAGGDPDPELGRCEGRLVGPNGEAILYEHGMSAGATRIRYDAIVRLELDGGAVVASTSGGGVRIASSESGGAVLFATLRWIGNAILRRDLT
jgi:hypothetical protein